MSVRIEVTVEDTGATMVFERSYTRTSGSGAGALRELDQGYKMIRAWLESQRPPFPGDQAASRPEPEKRAQEVVRETIQDDAKRSRGWLR